MYNYSYNRHLPTDPPEIIRQHKWQLYRAGNHNFHHFIFRKAGDKIKFSLASNVKEGELEMILHDSEGREVYRLDKAKELETFYTLEKTDTYTLNAQCNNFTGKFKIKVYKVK